MSADSVVNTSAFSCFKYITYDITQSNNVKVLEEGDKSDESVTSSSTNPAK